MKTILKITLALVTLLAVTGPANLPSATNDAPIVQITGGSTGLFVATPHSLTTSGYSDFSVNVKLLPDGTASGEFTCAIPDFVVLAVQVTNWSRRPDGGIQLTGNEYGYDAVAGMGYTDCPATIVMRSGPVGIGGFDFSDCVFPEGKYDTEVVRYGSIDFRHH
jgi:hypothetical protein